MKLNGIVTRRIYFPKNTEISFYDYLLQENHRADIHTKEGIIIEFQNSPLSAAELLSRNKFYCKIIWVVNGSKFKGFSLIKNIPDPNNLLLDKYGIRGKEIPLYMRKSDVAMKARMIEVLGMQSP
jgi:competence protein CoiA